MSAGTLKVEIVKPVGETWQDVGDRLHALRRVIPVALNETMRALYPRAMAHVRGEPATPSLETAIYRAAVKDDAIFAAALARDAEWATKQGRDVSRSHAPILAAVADATAKTIQARFAGEHLRDLRASRTSIPSWRHGAPLVARAADCSVSGPASVADLAFPLWASGRKATVLRVAPCGDSGTAVWRRLTDGTYKLGSVGIRWDERRRKWFALISWTCAEEVEPSAGKRVAAVNMGIHTFLVAVADGAPPFSEPGGDILTTRKRMAHRRWSISKSLNTLGDGSHGHGRARREEPLTRIADKEARFAETKNRQVAAALVGWCQRHGVGALALEDLSGVRDSVGADDAPEVKRLVHQWPHYALRQAIERAASKVGIAVAVFPPRHNSQRCPWCEHVAPENVRLAPSSNEFLVHGGHTWIRKEKRQVFACVSCGKIGDGDVVACMNALSAIGRPSGDVVKKTRKAASKKVMKVMALC